ncbi:hypothetical protein TNCV_4054401 [Trichonephila clavipes]|nr:hypothetical protein TNCV_4054401 [Trichonephila clavipes]
MFLAGHPSQGCFGLQSHCAPCYFFNQASFYPSDFSFIPVHAAQNHVVSLRRRLKTKRAFVQGVLELKEQLNIDFIPEPIVPSLDPTIDKGFRIETEHTQSVSKKELNTSILRSLLLETIDTIDPEPDWMHIYIDGSPLKDSDTREAGVYCHLFSFYLTIEKFTTAFDGEVAALQVALAQLHYE